VWFITQDVEAEALASGRSSRTIDEAARCWQQGDLTQAEALAKKALRRDKRDVNARQLLGLIAKQRGWFDEAAEHFEKCVRMRGEEAMSHCRLAGVRMLQGRFDDAIEGYERALALDGEFPTAMRGKAEVLERRGELDAAYALLAPAATRASQHAETILMLASLEVKRGAAAAAVTRLESLAARGDLQSTTRRQVYFTMGRALEHLERFDEAFEAYVKANAAAGQPFDLRAKTERTDRMITFFSSERVRKLPRANEASELPVFIVGMPRSGSTLIEQIIDAHPEAYGAGELTTFNEVVTAISAGGGQRRRYPEAVEGLSAAALGRLGKRYLNRVGRLKRGAARVADKNLLNYNHLGLIALLFPQARVIHCRRDALDTALSCFVNDLSPVGFPWAGDLPSIGAYYREYARLMAHWREVSEVRMLEVEYEELVRDTERVIREIIAFCGLRWDEACARPHESGRAVTTLSYDQVRRPVYRTSVRRHERYARHLGPLREALELENC